MSNCRRLLCRQLSSAYLSYLPFYFLIYRPLSLCLTFPILLFKVSLNSTLTKHVRPIHQRTKAPSLTHHCILKHWNIHFFFPVYCTRQYPEY
ncbi:CEI_1a_G0044790.mRNA.1.CDS.1 [Saccharomyces cerevisiae]|nr:CEI_1a_G0044790.mRNA.1.CDS.1 [Saccharomyces cerevisiae]CAI4730005.1 AMH_1a_G0044890.mRNA.1.CDS.1 [Saccharomyces cerevisiae]CAI6857253.1 AMH_1a_G0044890.mRNA.1.CDS.1 [Saccharomyces cerevisiae]CAI7441121.1 CEI_1a_G0044790.mRNA.1.CDS.1 [Saccharomyces cerevisiae]